MSSDLYSYVKRLFPLCRSITGRGVRDTVEILQEIIPLQRVEIPSGTQVFDWQIPLEWNVCEAYVADQRGERVIDFTNHNLHLVGYSKPFEGWITLKELQEHLYSLPEHPDWIPYVTSYYKSHWGFCLTERERKKLTEQLYYVKIESRLEPGSMTLADLVLPGESEEEIFFSTYICHPSMANNELSGPVVAAFLAKELMGRSKRRYTYRFAFVPETIGAIAYLSQNLDTMRKQVQAGYVITCVGDRGPFSYLKTRGGDTLSDRVVEHLFSHLPEETKQYSWLERGSDERQYNWPGVDLPIGSLMRSKYGEYPEYHTSADDLDFIDSHSLQQSLHLYLNMVDILEGNRTFSSATICEPQLSSRGLYPTLSRSNSGLSSREMIDILAYSDGVTDLLTIANLLKRPMSALKQSVEKLLQANLLIPT